jgi:hypothetical protein
LAAILFTVVLSSRSGAAEARPWSVEHGQSRAEIILADRPARSARLAAADLQEYVQKISGARLPIVSVLRRECRRGTFPTNPRPCDRPALAAKHGQNDVLLRNDCICQDQGAVLECRRKPPATVPKAKRQLYMRRDRDEMPQV